MGKKVRKIIVSLLVLSSIVGIIPTQTVWAQWGEVICPGMQVCYGCNSHNCNVYKVQDYSGFYNYDECKKIVANGSKISDWTGYASMVTVIKPIAATWLGLYSMSVSRNLQMFKDAVAKGTGIELKSEYVTSKTSYSLNQYRKGNLSYKNQDGWNLIENKWYYYENGYVVRGWKQISDKWYYLDTNTGAMATGWKEIDGRWYFLHRSSGAMETSWQQIDGRWYFLHRSSGAMETSWQQIDGRWYFLHRSSGAMETSWQQIDGQWYFLHRSSGAMETNTVVDGWQIDGSGVARK